MIAQTGVDGIMIGRAAVGNPWIFDHVTSMFGDRESRGHDLDEHRAMVFEHLDRLIELKTIEQGIRRRKCRSVEESAVRHFRCHLVRYLCGFSCWSDVRRSLEHMASRAEVEQAIDMLIERQKSIPLAAGGRAG